MTLFVFFFSIDHFVMKTALPHAFYDFAHFLSGNVAAEIQDVCRLMSSLQKTLKLLQMKLLLYKSTMYTDKNPNNSHNIRKIFHTANFMICV